MKISNYKSTLLVMLTLLSIVACDDFLEEENRDALTIENAISNTETFDQLVASTYERARENTTHYTSNVYYTLEDLGTDIVTRGGVVSGANAINDYVNMNSTNWDFELYWGNQYAIISAANTALDNADIIEGIDESTKSRGIGEVKFFRAWSYFNLVENFGGVPLILEQLNSSQTEFVRNTEQEVYEQIIVDLQEAESLVDESPDEYGRVSKNAVRHLTSKVLLTRGYKSFADASDFSEAASLAEIIINNFPLVSTFSDLVDKSNQRNSEVVFAYLFGSDVISRGWGNSRHMMYKFRYFDYQGLSRGNTYQKGLGPGLTPFYYSLFEPEDEREEATFRRIIYAEEDSENGSILAGDTAIFFPKVAWSQAEIDTKPYAVINPDTYYSNNGVTDVHYPMFKKFDDPGIPFTQPDQMSLGERDMVMMRAGEAYLIAAEAYLQMAENSLAASFLTTLRERAGLTTAVNENEVTVDFILDERARELAGEVNRWMDLKRTNKLIERTLAHNPHAALNNALSTKHLLRPIPQREIDISGGSILQNDY